MRMIFRGRWMGDRNFMSATSKTSPLGAWFTHRTTRSIASAPPAIRSCMSWKPASLRRINKPSTITAGSVLDSSCKVRKRISRCILSVNPMNAPELFSLKNRVAVVLGGPSGIGLPIARGFAQAGAITIASSRDQAKVDATAAELEALGARTLRITSDVQDRASLQRLCDETVLAYGQGDVLMVTSGALKKIPSVDLTDDDCERVVDINLNGTFRANQSFGRQMLEQVPGSIINNCTMTTF